MSSAPVPHQRSVLAVGHDEEIGSPQSRGVIEETAHGARAVYNAEPGRANGNVVSRRKGGVFMVLDVLGKAAHSGAIFEAGRSAIHALAHKTVAIAGLTDLSLGVTLNVGLVSGGQSVNTVAPAAHGEIDMRYARHVDRDRIIGAIGQIVATEHVPGTSATLTIKGEFLPLEQTDGDARLLKHYKQAALRAGLTLDGEFDRRVRRFRLHLGGGHADAVRHRSRRWIGAYAGGISGGGEPGAAGDRARQCHCRANAAGLNPRFHPARSPATPSPCLVTGRGWPDLVRRCGSPP